MPMMIAPRLFVFSPVVLAALLAAAPQAEARSAKDSILIGRVEKVRIDETGSRIKARIDTGAGVSSLNAQNIRIADDDKGVKMVWFDVDNDEGGISRVRRPLVGYMRIKLKKTKTNPQGGFTKRPVVRLDMCLGSKKVEGRVNLADRSHMIYPLLIGRNTLKTGGYVVDVRSKFTRDRKSCAGNG
jgi:hypothetical protein